MKKRKSEEKKRRIKLIGEETVINEINTKGTKERRIQEKEDRMRQKDREKTKTKGEREGKENTRRKRKTRKTRKKKG